MVSFKTPGIRHLADPGFSKNRAHQLLPQVFLYIHPLQMHHSGKLI